MTLTLIIHVIRTNKIPLLQSQSSWPVLVMSLVIMAIGIAIPFSPVGPYLEFSKLPMLYRPLLAADVAMLRTADTELKMLLLRLKWI